MSGKILLLKFYPIFRHRTFHFSFVQKILHMPSYLANSPFWTLILSGQLHPFAESNLTSDNGILYHYERLDAHFLLTIRLRYLALYLLVLH